MKYVSLLLGLALTSSAVMAQEQEKGEKSLEITPVNQVKFNLLPLLGGKISFEYERGIGKNISLGTAVSFRPNSTLPFMSSVTDLVDDEDINKILEGFKSSNFSITPEFRFYTNGKGNYSGFYLAPYVKYASYKLEVPYDFDVNEVGVYDRTETIPLTGNLSSFVGGVSIGVAFKLSDRISLDWRLIGPGYGFGKGDVSGKMKLDADEQQGFKDQLSDLKTDLADLPLAVKIESNVTSEGADVTVKNSPWASIRSGLSIGFRF